MGCNQPGAPVNGRGSWTHTSAGSTVHYSCENGFKLQGAPSITCSRGKWSGAVPKCESKCC